MKMKVVKIFFITIILTIFIHENYSAILSSFRNRQREIRQKYLSHTLHDCNAKSKTLTLVKKYPLYEDRGYLPPKESYSKNNYNNEYEIAQLLLPPKPSLNENHIHGHAEGKINLHDCKTSATLKLLKKLRNQ